MPRMRPLAALVLAALTATAGLAVPPATAETAPGEVVLPPVYTDKIPSVQAVLGSSAGIFWSQDGGAPRGEPGGGAGTTRYSLYGGAQRVRVDAGNGEGDNGGVTLVGTQLAFRTGDWNAEGISAVDIVTGKRTVLRAGSTNKGLHFITGTGDGWLERYDGVLRTVAASGAQTFYPSPGGWSGYIRAVDADARGALLIFEGAPVRVGYLDFASGTWTQLAAGDETGAGALLDTQGSLSADRIVWGAKGILSWADRTDPAQRGSTSVGYGIRSVSTSGGNVAFVRHARRVAGGPLVFRTYSGRIGGPYTEVVSSRPLLWVTTEADDGDFAVAAGDTVTDRGMYRLHPASTSLSAPIMTFGPSAPLGIDASAGRLVTVTPRQARTAESRTVTSDTEVESLTAGGSSTLTATLPDATPPELSGGHSAYLTGEGDARVAVVQDGTREIARYAVPASAHAVRLSGRRLLVASDGSSLVIDLDTGGRTVVPYTRAMFGDAIAYLRPAGEIRRRDLRTGAETVLREAGLPAGRTEPLSPRRVVLELHGDWALWSLPPVYPADESGRGPAPLETVALNVTTGQRTDLVAGINAALGEGAEIRLAGGVAAWIDQPSRAVHVADLSAGTTREVGQAWRLYSEPRSWLALTDEFVAWVEPDDSTHLLPLGAAAEGAPRYLGTVDADVFSAAGADYRPQIDVSRPLSAWTMTITGSGGNAVRTLKGSARSGGVRPVWNGLTADGRKVADGVYTWTLTGTGIGGGLRRANGGTGAIKGTVRVDSTTPAPKVTSPLRAGVAGFTVRWSSAERGVRFTVTVARRKTGTTSWSAARTWRKRTTATSARYSGRPYALRNGYAYKITVIAVDAAGNKRATSVVTRIRQAV